MIHRLTVFLILATMAAQVSTLAWSHDQEGVIDERLAERPSRKWKYTDLESNVNDAMQGRSFVNGQQIFKIVKCNSCHRMNGEGNELGPNLASLDREWTPARILRHTLEPSLDVNKEYRTHIFELESGQVISGLITAVGINSLKIVENPLVKKQPKTVKTATIQQRRTSRQSIMPTGLLDKLTRPEILDLLAYVYSGGNDRHAVFQGDGNDQ